MNIETAYFKGEGKERAFYFTKEYVDLVASQNKHALDLYVSVIKERMEKNTPMIYLESK